MLELLAETLRVPKSRLGIAKGHTSRNKVISVEGLTRQELESRLDSK